MENNLPAKVLVVYAHPQVEGHCSTLLSEVRKILSEKKADYEILDLYGKNYDPALHENELFTSGNRDISGDNLAIQEQIKNSSRFIFVYPVWWSSMPASLKGFFDRVLTPRFAYRYEGMIPKKLLTGKKALVFMTSGSPKIYLWLTGNRPKKLIKRDILGFCGIKAKVVQIGGCRKWKEEKIPGLKKIVGRELEKFM